MPSPARSCTSIGSASWRTWGPSRNHRRTTAASTRPCSSSSCWRSTCAGRAISTWPASCAGTSTPRSAGWSARPTPTATAFSTIADAIRTASSIKAGRIPATPSSTATARCRSRRSRSARCRRTRSARGDRRPGCCARSTRRRRPSGWTGWPRPCACASSATSGTTRSAATSWRASRAAGRRRSSRRTRARCSGAGSPARRVRPASPSACSPPTCSPAGASARCRARPPATIP